MSLAPPPWKTARLPEPPEPGAGEESLANPVGVKAGHRAQETQLGAVFGDLLKRALSVLPTPGARHAASAVFCCSLLG